MEFVHPPQISTPENTPVPSIGIIKGEYCPDILHQLCIVVELRGAMHHLGKDLRNEANSRYKAMLNVMIRV